MYVLGIDQGIAHLGYAIICDGELIEYGCLLTKPSQGLEKRFYAIYSKVKELMEVYHPSYISGERLFYTSPMKGNRNKSASMVYTNMITGILAAIAGEYSIELVTFVPSAVKKAVCGTGKAEKDDIINKIHEMFDVETTKSRHEHICDAIAIALTCYENKKQEEAENAKKEIETIKEEEEKAKEVELKKKATKTKKQSSSRKKKADNAKK